MVKINSRLARNKRHARVRRRVEGVQSRPRLCVYRSLSHIYAQIIDDISGHTLTSASSLDPEILANSKDKTKTDVAELVGTLVSERAKSQGVNQVVFDRGGYKYHGRVKALAESAREAGLAF